MRSKASEGFALPTGREKVAAVTAMFDAIAGRYDLVNRVMTAGMDVRWRRRTVSALGLPRGSVVLDAACGTGDLCRELRKAGLVAFGFDLSRSMLAVARTRAPLVLSDALRLPVRAEAVDGVTCGFALRNVSDIDLLLEEFARVLRPGGRVSILEVATPEREPLRWFHDLYFNRVVPMIGGVLSDREAYRYLPRSAAYLPSPDEMNAKFRSAGFVSVERTLLSLGAAQLLTANRL